jgi:hypothetical protein
MRILELNDGHYKLNAKIVGKDLYVERYFQHANAWERLPDLHWNKSWVVIDYQANFGSLYDSVIGKDIRKLMEKMWLSYSDINSFFDELNLRVKKRL